MPKKEVKKQVETAQPAVFDPASLSIEQQQAVVEFYLGVHPDFFLYEGLQIKLNFSRFEAENRRIAQETGNPRVCFNGWKPKGRRDW